MIQDFCPLMQHSCLVRGKGKQLTLAPIVWKGGHSHCVPAHMGFWERTLKPKVGRSLTLALPCIGGNGKCQDCLGFWLTWLEVSSWRQGAALGCLPSQAAALGTLRPSAGWYTGPGLLSFSHSESSTQRCELGGSFDGASSAWLCGVILSVHPRPWEREGAAVRW